MSFLDKMYHLISRNKQDDTFDLNELKENIRKYHETHPQKDSPKQTVKFQEWEKERIIEWKNDPLIVYGRSKDEKRNDEKRSRLINPPLLAVKMFLADVTYLTNMPYDRIRHNCSDFSKDVQDAATKRGWRCGYVRFTFQECEIGHAIVCFDTDHGLKFFEPQTADEEDAIIGRRYSGNVSENGTIDKIEIFWNDDVYTVIDKPYPYYPE